MEGLYLSSYSEFQAASRLINQAVGDAISDMLLVLSSLQVTDKLEFD